MKCCRRIEAKAQIRIPSIRENRNKAFHRIVGKATWLATTGVLTLEARPILDKVHGVRPIRSPCGTSST